MLDPTLDPAQRTLFAEKTFAELGLQGLVLEGITAAGFEKPTPIQAALIPLILQGRDVIGLGRTGTGKTAAFGLPLLQMADPDQPGQALILAPTRELAQQVARELTMLGELVGIAATCIIGGESMRDQQKSMSRGGHLIVGTPGRVTDMHQRGQLSFANIRFVVLDEVDRMFDIGFREDIRKILALIAKQRQGQEVQTTFVSATLDDEIERLARRFMRPDAQKIQTIAGSLTVEMVEQKYLAVEAWDKPPLLRHLLTHESPDTTLVFCRTKATVRRLSDYLERHKISCRQIHGDMPQEKRNKVIKSLREGDLDVLIASDLAARGLDVAHISHVINYDLPEDPEVYVHRIGRTARVGRHGIAWSFVTPEQGQLLTQIEKLTGAMIEHLEYPDFTPGTPPSDVQEHRQRERQRMENLQNTTKVRELQPQAQDELSQEQMQQMFPGGVVPKGKPRSTLASRFRKRR